MTIQRENLATLPRWHHRVFQEECAEARRQWLRAPTQQEQALLLPLLVALHNRECLWDPLVGIGMTVSAIRRATGIRYTPEAVYQVRFGTPRTHTSAEIEEVTRVWVAIFGAKKMRPAENEQEPMSTMVATTPKQAQPPGRPSQLPAENLIELLDVMARRGIFTGNGKDVEALRGAALRCRIKCGFSEQYLANRIREAMARAAQEAPA